MAFKSDKQRKAAMAKMKGSTRRKKQVVFPREVEVGETKLTMPPISEKEERERTAFSRAVMYTPQYKKLIKQGISKPVAIQLAGEGVAVRKGKKWFSISRLPPKLQSTAKKFHRQP